MTTVSSSRVVFCGQYCSPDLRHYLKVQSCFVLHGIAAHAQAERGAIRSQPAETIGIGKAYRLRLAFSLHRVDALSTLLENCRKSKIVQTNVLFSVDNELCMDFVQKIWPQGIHAQIRINLTRQKDLESSVIFRPALGRFLFVLLIDSPSLSFAT